MLTHEMLASVMTFDPEKGRFFWLGKNRGQPAGKEVGSFDGHGYGQINVFGKVRKEHRLVWLWVYGELPPGQIDHINHERRDNRPCNLRLVDNVENHRNRPIQRGNQTGCPGVWYDAPKNRYRVYININGKRINLGSRKDVKEAIALRLEANNKYGFHKNHGDDKGRPKPLPLKMMISTLGLTIKPGHASNEELKAIKADYQRRVREMKRSGNAD